MDRIYDLARRVLTLGAVLGLVLMLAPTAACAQFIGVSGPCKKSGTCSVGLTAPSFTLGANGVLAFPSNGTVEITGAGQAFSEVGSNYVSVNGDTGEPGTFTLSGDAGAGGLALDSTGTFALVGTTATITVPAVTIGSGGTKIGGSYRGTVTTDLASIPANSCADQSITVAGAVIGAECTVGMPATTPGGLSWGCHVTAADTASLHVCNVTVGAIDPASATYSARVWNP